jgi:hypothetical protein
MPMDCILMGSRWMTCKEAATAYEVCHRHCSFHSHILQTHQHTRAIHSTHSLSILAFARTHPRAFTACTLRHNTPRGHFPPPSLSHSPDHLARSSSPNSTRKVKKLICAAPGVKEESEWEDSYEGIAGGIVTVRSELGEPIHNVACRGLKTWRQFDKKYFLQPRDKRAALIAADKDWIISQLNANYQKPYFGRKADGSVCDLPDMTYAEVLRRLVQLMYVTEPKGEWPEEDLQKYRFKRPRWIDVTYESRTFKVRKKSHVHLLNAMQFICARMLECFARAITGASWLLPLLPPRLFSPSFLRDVLDFFLSLVFMLMRARR